MPGPAALVFAPPVSPISAQAPLRQSRHAGLDILGTSFVEPPAPSPIGLRPECGPPRCLPPPRRARGRKPADYQHGVVVAQRREWGIVRVLDLLLLKKDPDEALEAFEIADLDDTEIGELRSYEAELAMLLSEGDVAAVEPGSTAALMLWENT